MKIEYLSEMPSEVKQKYTKWMMHLTEFWKSDLPIMKITFDPETDGKAQASCSNIRRSIRRCGYRMEAHYRGNIIIIEKLTD